MGEPSTAVGPRARWYLPTTRNNAIGMLSGGIVAPVHGLPNYYEDVQSLSPARILLTSCGACREWFSPVHAAGRDLPAILELDVAVDGDTLTHADTTILSCDVAVPISRITTVHLATQVHADEFTARRYDNFDPSTVDVAMSPALFDQPLPAVADVEAWLRSLGGPGRDVAGDLRAVDVFGGVLSMLLACPPLASDELTARKVILDRLLEPGTRHVLDALSVVEWLSPDLERDTVLLRASVTVLQDLSPAPRMGSRRVVAAIRESIARDWELDAIVTANLDWVESVLRSTSELGRLTRTSGLRTAKALLLFLLRPSPGETLTWVEDRPDDPLAVLGACAFNGMTAGMRLLPTDARKAIHTDLAADVMADRFNVGAERPVERFGHPTWTARIMRAVDGDEASVSLRVGETDLGTAMVHPDDDPAGLAAKGGTGPAP